VAKSETFVGKIRTALGIASVLAGGCMTTQTLAAPADSSTISKVEKIVVVGDIHGAHSAFVELLQATDLIDSAQNWSGGNTHLVSLGDILDRGAESRKSMDLLMKLQVQSARAGGQVHVVAGNHELMNLTGDLRYVSDAEYAAFAGDETEAMRSAGYQVFKAHSTNTYSSKGLEKRAFNQTYDKGYFAHRAAFAPDGKYGKWLLSLPAIAVVNDSAFVHGGLPAMIAESGLDRTNQNYQEKLTELLTVRQELFDENLLPDDELQDLTRVAQKTLDDQKLKKAQKRKLSKFIDLDDSEVLNSEGPLWYRGAMMCRPVFEKPILEASLAKLGVNRVVVGHTPSPDGEVHTRYGGKLIQLDTGMLVSHYKGRPAALVIRGSDIKVQYLSPTQNSALSKEQFSPAVLADKTIEDALRMGSIRVLEKGAQGVPSIVTVSYNGKFYDGQFYADNKEAIAYQLDKMLGFDIVPPTVVRSLGTRTGSLQFSYEKSVSDTVRQAENISIGGWCPITRQYQLMYVFDLLTANGGRTGDNLFFKKDQGLIYLTDFNKAFGNLKKLPVGARRASIQLTPEMRRALAGLNASTLASQLQGILDEEAITALLSRRDAILKTFK
jgi:hypothetical protein